MQVLDIEDLARIGESRSVCPYYLARQAWPLLPPLGPLCSCPLPLLRLSPLLLLPLLVWLCHVTPLLLPLLPWPLLPPLTLVCHCPQPLLRLLAWRCRCRCSSMLLLWLIHISPPASSLQGHGGHSRHHFPALQLPHRRQDAHRRVQSSAGPWPLVLPAWLGRSRSAGAGLLSLPTCLFEHALQG